VDVVAGIVAHHPDAEGSMERSFKEALSELTGRDLLPYTPETAWCFENPFRQRWERVEVGIWGFAVRERVLRAGRPRGFSAELWRSYWITAPMHGWRDDYGRAGQKAILRSMVHPEGPGWPFYETALLNYFGSKVPRVFRYEPDWSCESVHFFLDVGRITSHSVIEASPSKGGMGFQQIIRMRGCGLLLTLEELLGARATRELIVRVLEEQRGGPITVGHLDAAIRAHEEGRWAWLAEDYLMGTALPGFRIQRAVARPVTGGWEVSYSLANEGTGRMLLPLQIVTPGGPEDFRVWIGPGEEVSGAVTVESRPRYLVVDPGDRIFRFIPEDAADSVEISVEEAG
jgi:hypothetical protein